PQDLGEGRQQQSRRSQTQASSTRLQAAPRLGLQTAVTANEALCRELARVADQRQLRARGQAVEASQPVLAGSAERLALAQGVLGQHVIAERQPEARLRREGIDVELEQLAQQDLEAPGIGEQVVEAQEEAHLPTGEAAGTDVEQR